MQPLRDLLGIALVVQLEQPVEHLLARYRRERKPRPELGLVKAVAKVEVGPAVGVADRVVELDVELAQPGDVVGVLVGSWTRL